MVEKHQTCTKIDTEIGLLPFPVDRLLRVVSHIETKLGTGKELEFGRLSQAEAITEIDGNGNLLLLDGCIRHHSLVIGKG